MPEIGTVTAYHERSGWGWLHAEDGACRAKGRR
jgi:hypothetical protein